MPPPVLLSAEGLTRAYGAWPLFRGLALALRDGERLGLVGPNGSGKSTLLRILAGLEEPDAGTVTRRRGLRIGFAEQVPAFDDAATVGAVVERAAADVADPAGRARLVAVTLGRAGFHDADQPVATLSGGWRKRLAIARELVRQPELLLLDEPTNHLDLEGILWLEELLSADPPAFVVISHDRAFLERVTRRTIEIDRRHAAGLFESEGRFSDFLERRDEQLRGQGAYQAALANRVRGEIDWLRRGPKARTTKAQARIDQAERMIDELEDLTARAASGARAAGIDFAGSERRTKRLLETFGLTKAFGARRIVERLDLLLSPGTRLGLVGPNGCGKTTLLRLLAGELAPDAGEIRRAPDLAVVYFEQQRESLDPEASLRRALAPEGDAVIYRGRPIHVAGWAQRFLFPAERLDTPVHRLSGGERARVLIARLMLRPADVLILDEPTNDLDLTTLEVLEESLADFPGALVLVTHDRYLLDAACEQLLAFEGDGSTTSYAGYAQYAAATAAAAAAKTAPRPKATPRPREAAKAKKLSYHEQREWDAMEERILAAEEAAAAAEAAAADPAIASDAVALQERLAALAAAREAIDTLYARWGVLEAKLREGA